jgi:colanic acid biosynthesis glycosyl transferase WcaI
MTTILFITSYYPPEKGAAAVRISETAGYLARQGHQVRVLTTVPNYPTGIVPPEYRGRIIQQEKVNGVQVVRVWSYVTANKGFLRRILAQLSFGCLAPLLGWKQAGCPDIIIVDSHPLFNAIAGRMLAWSKRCPFIFTVSDLWPESAVQMEVLHNKLLIWLAERLEWSTYRRASLVWAITQEIQKRLIQRGLAPQKIFLLRNGVSLAKFCPMTQSQARAALGWEERFIILYAGTLGPSHGLKSVLDAAKQLQDRDDISFVLAGDGAGKAALVAQAQKDHLKNVTFLDPVPHEQIPQLLAAADVCLVHMLKVMQFQGTSPMKMYEAMASARPILLGLDGEARKLAEQEAGAALYVEPENAEALVAGVLYLCEHPDEARRLGQNGRAFLETRFDRERLTAELDVHIATLLQTKKGPGSSEMLAVSTIREKPVSVNVTPPGMSAPSSSESINW